MRLSAGEGIRFHFLLKSSFYQAEDSLHWILHTGLDLWAIDSFVL